MKRLNKKTNFLIRGGLTACMLMLLAAPKTTHPMSIIFTKQDDNKYVITGSISESDLVWNSETNTIYPFRVIAHTTGIDNYFYNGSMECTKKKATAVEKINKSLSEGITVTKVTSMVGGDDWSVKIACSSRVGIGLKDDGTWQTFYSAPTPPPQPLPKCTVTVPETITFPAVLVGRSGTRQTDGITINCDKSASGKLEILATDNGNLKIDDAVVTLLFDNKKTQYDFNKIVTKNLNLVTTLKDTGTATGEKKGSVVLRITWN